MSIQAPARFDLVQTNLDRRDVLGDVSEVRGFMVLHIVGTQLVTDTRLFDFPDLKHRVAR